MKVNWKEDDDLTDEESFLLHGNCNGFVEQNYQNGDNVIVLIEYDYEIEKDCLLHCFIKRNDMYFDVRGMTDNMEDVLNSFDYGEYNKVIFDNIRDFNKLMKKMKIA